MSFIPLLGTMKQPLANAVARAALGFKPLERMIAAACRRPALLKSFGVGAVAVGYSRVLSQPELRVADMQHYRLQVNVAEELGIGVFFFGNPGTLWFTPRLLRPGDCCVDAGANMGHYTFAMASEVGPSGRVLAFEANPAFVEMLNSSIAINQYEGRIVVYGKALWEGSDLEMTFYISMNSANSGTSSLVNHGFFLSPDRHIVVRTVTLDDAAREASIDHFRLVKIDVERAEEFVITGAHHLLSEHRIDFLIVELIAGTKAQELLSSHGYTGWLASNDRTTLTPIGEVTPGVFGDFLFASPAVLGEVALLSPNSGQ